MNFSETYEYTPELENERYTSCTWDQLNDYDKGAQWYVSPPEPPKYARRYTNKGWTTWADKKEIIRLCELGWCTASISKKFQRAPCIINRILAKYRKRTVTP